MTGMALAPPHSVDPAQPPASPSVPGETRADRLRELA